MRFCPFSRLGLAAGLSALCLLVGLTPAWSLGQDNPLRSIKNSDERAEPLLLGGRPNDEELLLENDDENREGRELAERIASICGQQIGPWLQWLTLASQSHDLDSVREDSSSVPIIEIPEATLRAIQTQEEIDASNDDPAVEIAESDSECSMEPSLEDASEGMVLGAPDSSDAPDLESTELTLAEPAKPLTLAAPESSPRNVRTPRSFKDLDDPDPSAPRALSESMKSKSQETESQETESKRSIKSADEDMRDYLAQEEPTAQSVRNSINDQLEGVDAHRAAKPDTRNAPEDGVNRPPTKSSSKSERSKSEVPAPMQQRLQRSHACLDHYLRNAETTTARSPWAVMHALLPYGADYELIGPNGRVNAIGWMCHNGLCRTQRIFTPRGESFVPNVGGGVQGHEGQFLAILAQCQVPLDYSIQIGSKKFTVEDLVRYEMATCKERTELTFKLIGLSYYVDADKQWRSNDGKIWSIEKLVREELAQPVVGAACGGTHRLMGLSFSLRQRELQGFPINGQFARSAKFINEYVRYTWQLQNPDGSFSTHWYQGRANDPDDERKVQTSGHMLEWLMFTVSDDELTSPRVEKAVDFLLSRIYDRRDHKWPIGPRGHATRALALYNLRIEALLEQRSGVPADSIAQQRLARPDAGKAAVSTPSTPTRPPQAAPGGRPVGQPASRSTSRPYRRVRG